MTQKKASTPAARRKTAGGKQEVPPDTHAPAGRKAKTPQDNGEFRIGLSTSREELLDEGGNSDNDLRQFLYDFSVLASQLETARAHLAAHIGVTPPQYNILMVIARKQGKDGISVSDVARRLHVSVAFVTTEARKLENIGLIVKKPNPNDARGTLLMLSPDGEACVHDVEPERLFVNDQLFQSLTRDDFRHLSRAMTAMLDDFAHTIAMLQMRQERSKRARDRKAG
jgi:DNA-binding MarR family transcriptional regulator